MALAVARAFLCLTGWFVRTGWFVVHAGLFASEMDQEDDSPMPV